MKKFVALMMTLALVLALAVPVVAAGGITNSAVSAGTTGIDASYTGSTNVPTLNVTVKFSKVDNSNKAYLVLNPYKLEIGTGKPGAGEKTQVIASPVEIANSTADCDVDVIVKGAHATYTKVAVASKPIDDTKQVSEPTAYLVVYGGDADNTAVPKEFTKNNQVLISQDASNTVAAVVTTVPKGTGKKYVLIGGSLATNLKLDATDFWGSGTTVTDIGYTLMIRAAAPAATSSST